MTPMSPSKYELRAAKPPPAPVPQVAKNDTRNDTAAEAKVHAAAALAAPSEFDAILSPFIARAFAVGIGQSDGGTGNNGNRQ